MYEDLVNNVREVFNGALVGISLTYDLREEPGAVGVATYSREAIGAIETWLAQPKSETAEQRAKRVVALTREDIGGAFSTQAEREYLDKLFGRVLTEICAAEEAARG